MATFFFDRDCQTELVLNAKIGIIGYGSQGRAHALNLRDRGCAVEIGLHADSKSRPRAKEDGFEVLDVEELTQQCDWLVFCTPDIPMRHIYNEKVAPHLREGQLLLFAHGLNIAFGLIQPPPKVDVALLAPKGPGQKLRTEFEAGKGMPGIVGVDQDASGQTLQKALAYGWAIGCGRGGILLASSREEAVSDMFGEQAVLCGGISALVKAGFETLVEAGIQPEVAYIECLHETKLVVDLLVEGGLSYMHYAISDTAEWGDYISGPKVVGGASRQAMKEVLNRIQDGSFVEEMIQEMESGGARMKAFRTNERELPIETIGAEMRRHMTFLSPKTVPEGY